MRAESVTRALAGTWFGRFGMARCPAHEDRTPSLSIRDGDSGLLLLYCHAGCDYEAVLAAVSVKLGSFGNFGQAKPRPVDGPSRRTSLMPLVGRIWHETRPMAGTIAETYLRKRSIRGVVPRVLRSHRCLRHPSGARFPALIARVDDAAGSLVGLHRTYLDATCPKKTSREPAKAMLGQCKGASVHLRRGGRVLVVCEGIETGLSLCDALDAKYSVWAALSTSGVRGLILPQAADQFSTLLICADGDDAGKQAALCLGQRARTAGWTVEAIAPIGGLDFNDLAQGLHHG